MGRGPVTAYEERDAFSRVIERGIRALDLLHGIRRFRYVPGPADRRDARLRIAEHKDADVRREPALHGVVVNELERSPLVACVGLVGERLLDDGLELREERR